MNTMDDDIIALAENPKAFGKRFTVDEDSLDGFGHVNNAVYLKWIDQTIWEHTRHVGLDEQTCLQLNRGMAAIHHDIDYLAAAYKGDELVVFNWITFNDGRLRASRAIQIVRLRDKKTIVKASSDYICTNLKNGRPARMPPEFISGYAVEPIS